MLPEVIEKHKKVTGYNLFMIYKNSLLELKLKLMLSTIAPRNIIFRYKQD